MKTIILIFMQLYYHKCGNKATPDFRNYGHGIFGSIIWSIGFFVTAYFLNYQNYEMMGVVNGILLALLFGIAWELFQRKILYEYKFNWKDALAGNIWFIPLWFLVNLIRMLAPSAYLKAEKEFVDGK